MLASLSLTLESTSDNDRELLGDSDPEPSSPKRHKLNSGEVTRKLSGAARYKTKFQHVWQEKWPFVTPVRGDPHSFRCTVCNKLVSCGHQGEMCLVIMTPLNTRRV